jgi:hypothetical protein
MNLIWVPTNEVHCPATDRSWLEISDAVLAPPPPFTVRIFVRHRPEAWTARQPVISSADLLEHKSMNIIHQLGDTVNNLLARYGVAAQAARPWRGIGGGLTTGAGGGSRGEAKGAL